MQNAHFSPPQLAPIFGVNVSTIKRWSDKGYLPTNLTAGGHRRISREQLAQFVAKHPNYMKNSYVLRSLFKKNFCPEKDCWKKYYGLLVNDKNDEALRLLEKYYLSGTPIIDVLRIIITPAMRFMAEQWSYDRITVFDEHRMSFNMRRHLIKLELFVPDKSKKDSPVALLACAPGEYHELPLILVNIIFKQNGWKTHVLGINISANELIKAANKYRPQVLVISRTYTRHESIGFFKKVLAYAKTHSICLAVGGAAWEKKLLKKFWVGQKCISYFPALKIFSEFLNNYKRK